VRGVLLDDPDALLNPYVTTPRRIADEIVDALVAVPGVQAIALFGSLAAGTHDGFSDIDMLVGHDGSPGVAWACAAAVRVAKPVRFYRSFTGVEQPSGRYWFDGESPFHQVDVSFYAADAYERVRVDGVKEGEPITSKEVWRRDAGERPPPPLIRPPSAHPVAVSDLEWEHHGHFVYFLKEAKQYVRGRLARDEYDAAWRTFLEHTRGVRFDARTPAGRIGELIQDCWQVRAAIDRAEQGG
jgi:hypothetical protein